MTSESIENNLFHCIYSSASTIKFSRDAIYSLLEVSRKNNYQLGVTGILLYHSGSFFQVLEGAPDVLNSLYEKIEKDKRHTRLTKIIFEPIESRNFSDWTMGYSGITREELKKIDGLNDFFTSSKCYTDLDKGRAKMLLNAFKDGRWRSSIK